MEDLLSLAYPEMVRRIFPHTFNKTICWVNVEVELDNEGSVYGKIAALIKDNTSTYFRVGSMLLTRTVGVDELKWSSSDGMVHRVPLPLPLERSVVVVPSGWVLGIDVDLHVKTGNNGEAKNLKATFDFNNISTEGCTRKCAVVRGDKVHVTVTYCPWCPMLHNEDIGKQLSRPVEVVGTASGRTTIVYTIGDELSFIEFIMTLRRILADHEDHEDILDGHRLLNLSSTREHPLLTKQRAGEPKRWIQVKLQVVDGNDRTSWTTLFLRDDNVYVHGFMNQQQVVYELLNNRGRHMLPEKYSPKPLYWDITYSTILGVRASRVSDEVVRKLKEARLGRGFAEKAVRRLSSYDDRASASSDDEKYSRLSLAGLILMIAESARMNCIFKSFACGWNSNNGFTEQLMRDYVWGYYGRKSGELRDWKSKQYPEPVLLRHYDIKDLDVIYLVLNTRYRNCGKQENDNNQHQKPDDDPSPKRGQDDSSNGSRSSSQPKPKDTSSGRRRGSYDGRSSQGGPPVKRARNDGSSGGPAATQSMEASDGTSSGGPASSSSPVEAGDASTGGGSRQPNGNGSQPNGNGGDLYNGRPRVELLALAMRSKLCVAGMAIVVFDGKRGQIIYEHGEEQGQHTSKEDLQYQGEGGWVDLVLTGPDVGISAYGCFAIKIETPVLDAPIRWEWDCYSPMYAAQVDKTDVTQHIGDQAKVTYAVMSNALEATVHVMLRLKGGDDSPSGAVVNGKITAHTSGFDCSSVLFHHTHGTGNVMDQCFGPSDDDDERSFHRLKLARNVVAVPCGRVLHIVIDDLQIETSNNQGANPCFKANLDFANGIPSRSHIDKHGNQVEVKIDWYPEPEITRMATARPSEDVGMATKRPSEDVGNAPPGPSRQSMEVEMIPWHLPEVVYTIRDEMSYNGFIMALRRNLGEHKHREDIMGRHYDPNLSSTQEHSLLAKPRARQPSRWVHVKIQVEGEEMSTTTLVIRDDNLYLKGFMNKNGEWYEVTDTDENSALMLPANYRARRLPWGVSYTSIVVGGLGVKRLNKNFAIDAVRRLSRYPDEEYDEAGNRLALAGMVFMACEAARMIPQQEMVVSGWRSNESQPIDSDNNFLLFARKWNWWRMSRALLQWRSNGYKEWPNNDTASDYNALEVIKHVKLVLNAPEYVSRPKPQASGYGRPLVELLAISADLCVLGTTITVFDGKRGQIIYRHEDELREGGPRMVDLVLIGPYKPICAYGNFAIQVDIPVGNNSDVNDGGNIVYWEWDGNDPEYAAEVEDTPKLVRRRSINNGAYPPGRNINITYAVMKNALEAKVQVRLEIPEVISSDATVYGTVTAGAECFQVGSVLFSRGERRPPQAVCCFHNGHCLLPLARSSVAVPFGCTLHVVVDLTVVDIASQRPRQFRGTLSFSEGCTKERLPGENGSMQVDITWCSPKLEPNKIETDAAHAPDQISEDIAKQNSCTAGYSVVTEKTPADQPMKISEEIGAQNLTAPLQPSHPAEEKVVIKTCLQGDKAWDEIDATAVRCEGKCIVDVKVNCTMPRRVYQLPSIDVPITCNVDTGGYEEFIKELRRILAAHLDRQHRQHVLDHRDRTCRHVLPRQRHGKEPQRWINIRLVLRDDAETTLFVRDDNVYLIGFKNNEGQLFEFGFSGKSSRMINEGSTFLECDVNYGSLLHNGGAWNFVEMDLGRGFARRAVRRLSGYAHDEQRGIVDDRETRHALAGLMVMVCEAARMRPLQERAGWHADRCCGIEPRLVYYIWGWGNMSEALLRWKRELGAYQFPKCLQDIGVGSAVKALDIVELLLNTPIRRVPRWLLDRQSQQRPAAGDDDDACRRSESEQQHRAAAGGRPPSEKQQQPAAGEHGNGSGRQQSPPNKRRRTEQQHDQDPPPPPPPPSDKGSGESYQQETRPPVLPADDYVACGRPLVEVFAVRAGFHFVGTIAVFDGMRGQVIYKNNNGSSSRSAGDDDQGYAPLLLTGPYRAISAYGSFTIAVDISGAVMVAQQDQGAGEPSRDVGELNWDCYDEEKVYDKPVTETITTSRSGSKVEVTYAVLSDAVDTELDVHLRLPGATVEGRGAVVYGRIATRSKAFHDDEDQAWTVLFDSEVQGVSLVDDGGGSIDRLPLARSVVAMPHGLPLVIKATLYDAPPSQHGVSPVFQCQDMELTLEDGMRTRSADNGGEFEVSITSPDHYPRPTRDDTPPPTFRSHYDSCPN